MNAPAAGFNTCERCDGPTEPGDLRCALCALVVPAAPSALLATAAAHLVRCEGSGRRTGCQSAGRVAGSFVEAPRLEAPHWQEPYVV